MHVYGELSGSLTSTQTIQGALNTAQTIQGTLSTAQTIQGTLSATQTIQGALSKAKTIQGNITVPSAILPPSYEGEYTVTPSAETQTLNTDHLYMMDNITINPIPNNYGLITYNGVTITVS